MNLSRDFTLKIHFILDQLLPPVLRDSRLFMKFPMKLFFSAKHERIMSFKERAPFMTREEYAAFYEETAPFHMSRATDLNKKCARAILDNIVGESALDAGCGRGFLVKAIRDEGRCGNIYGMDIVIPDELREQSGINFMNGSAESIPFASSSVDTVICSHVLEHVVDLHTVISELRRVARRRVIIVVPSQRSYRYTFDLHLRFFPYIHSFLLEMMPFDAALIRCEYMDGDIYYQEDRDQS